MSEALLGSGILKPQGTPCLEGEAVVSLDRDIYKRQWTEERVDENELNYKG